MDRKGEESASGIGIVPTIIILMLVAVILFGLIMPRLLKISDKQFSDAECQASLFATRVQTLTPVCIAKQPALIPLRCSRKFFSVDKDSVLEGTEDVTDSYSSACPAGVGNGNTCLAHNVLAQQMAKCWDLFGNGEQVVFQQGEINDRNFWSGKDTARSCFVCSEITVSSGEIAKFTQYLKEASFSPDGKTQSTFYEYIALNKRAWCDSNLKSPTCWEGIAKERDPANRALNMQWIEDAVLGKRKSAITQDVLSGETTYAITFIRRGMSTCEPDGEPGDAQGYLTFSVQAIPVEQIRDQCEVVLA